MKLNSAKIPGMGLYFFRYLRKKGSIPIVAEELPLRTELFGRDQMKQHGRILATGYCP